MPTKTKAVVFTEPRKVQVQDVEIPNLEPKEIAVRTLFSGISPGTELWILTAKYWNAAFPTIPGYQKVGVVEAIGGEVNNFKVGDTVFLPATRLAPNVTSHWGGHTGYSVMDETNDWLFKLPAGLDPKDAALAVMSATGYHGAAEVMPIQSGESVVVIGLGLIGQFSAQVCHIRGANVIALDLIDWRLEQAAKNARAVTLNPTRQNITEEIKKRFPNGVDAVIDCSANAKVVNESFEWLRNQGRYCFQGYYPDKTPIDLLTPHVKELVMYNPTSVTGAGLRQCAQYLAEGKMNMKSLITHHVPVARAPQMYDMLLNRPNEGLGVILEW